jgi:hypothetical protein
MKNDSRYEIRLPSQDRHELDAVSDATGISPSDLARIGIRWVLDHRDALKLPAPSGESLRHTWPPAA